MGHARPLAPCSVRIALRQLQRDFDHVQIVLTASTSWISECCIKHPSKIVAIAGELVN